MKRTLAVIPAILLSACHRQEPKIEATVVPVRVKPVEIFQPANEKRYSATIAPGRQVSVGFRVSGIIADIHRGRGRGLEPGDVVAGGTILARLRQEDYQNSVAQAQSQLEATRESQRAATAQLAQAQASQSKAQADFARASTLMNSKSLTRPEYDAAKSQFDAASAQVDAAKAQVDSAAAQVRTAEASLATARLSQRDTILAAPFTASVVQRNVELGALAGPSQPAYTLADIGTVKASFAAPDTVMVQLRLGQRLAVSVEALDGREFRGAISAIAAVADSETRLFPVDVTIDNPGMTLKPGMIASISLGDAGPAKPVPVIPLSAVVRDRANPNDFAVMVVEGKIARARKVSLGSTFGEMLEVSSGLQAGELVIRAGGTMVNDGASVEVIP